MRSLKIGPSKLWLGRKYKHYGSEFRYVDPTVVGWLRNPPLADVTYRSVKFGSDPAIIERMGRWLISAAQEMRARKERKARVV